MAKKSENRAGAAQNKGREEASARRNNRAAAVAQAWQQHPGKNHKGRLDVTIGDSVVRIAHIEYGEENGTDYVDIWVGSHRGSPSFRICNPPTMIQDPRGDVTLEIPAPGGRVSVEKFRRDPVEAVAESIANLRGRR